MCGGGGPSATSMITTKGSKGLNKMVKAESKDLLGDARRFEDKWDGDTAADRRIYDRIGSNADIAEGYMPMQDRLIGDLYAGGGLGEGQDYIRDAWSQASQAYQPYLQGNYLDPMSNPYLQPSIEAARSGAFNDVADRFHKAGRSFSGAEAGAFGDAATRAALPMLMGQYNQNVGAQQGAAQGLLGGAMGASGGLDQSQQARLQAQMAAPGQIGNLNIPENMLLGIKDRQRTLAQNALMLRQSMVRGTPYNPTQVSTQTTQTDPFQTYAGAGIGLLGALM